MRRRYWMEPTIFSLVLLGIAALIIVPSWTSDGSGLRFESPWFLLGLLGVPFVVWAGIREKRTSGKIFYSHAKIAAASKRGLRTWLPPLSTGIRALVAALVVLALARPQDSNQRQTTEMEGIDIVIALDVSGSMATPDISPSRVEAAKEVVLEFIRLRKNDRIGAVIFAENAYTLCPLTLDYSIISQMIAELELGVIADKKTAIGNAIGVSLNRLRKSKAKSKTIILVTDGTSNAGNISPEQATQFSQTLGVKIYTILVGQNQKSQSINPALLIKMAEQTNGAFFKAVDKRELLSSFHTILDALERSKMEDQGVSYAEVFGKYLWPALILIALDLLMVLIVIRRTP